MKTKLMLATIFLVALASCSNKENTKHDKDIELELEYSHLWSTGDTTATINVAEPGEYWVEVTVLDSKSQRVLGSQKTCFRVLDSIAKQDNIEPEYSYLWSTGDTTETINVTEPGEYWVEVTVMDGKNHEIIATKKTCYEVLDSVAELNYNNISRDNHANTSVEPSSFEVYYIDGKEKPRIIDSIARTVFHYSSYHPVGEPVFKVKVQ